MQRPKLIAPSILSADFAKLGEEIVAVKKAGADWIHVDVMDGHFVDNITIGAPVVKSLRKATDMILDVHLMIENPEKYVDDFVQAGSDYITFHIETTKNPLALIKKIKSEGKNVGITLRPRTPLADILPYVGMVDLVLIMTVEPGFSGQSFMQDQVVKIQQLRRLIYEKKYSCLIEVDGGVNAETVGFCTEADVLVAGNFVFKNNYEQAIKILKNG